MVLGPDSYGAGFLLGPSLFLKDCSRLDTKGG